MAPRPMNQIRRFDAARLWRLYPRETVALGLLGFAASLALAGSAWSNPTLEGAGGASAQAVLAPPAPPPLLVRALAPEDAVAVNRAIPIAAGPNPAARPFSLGKASKAARAQALECLTSAIYYEAGSESDEGQKAVAQVVLNRVRHPAFPSTVCGVVYEGSTRATGCQFTFTCDGSLARRPVPALWERARKVAWAALTGAVHAPAGNATHYHADYVVPYWASSLTKNAVVDSHIFYRWAGGWGRPAAFSQRYAAVEPDSHALRLAALATGQGEAAEAEVEAIPGAELLAAEASKADDGKVAVRFNLAAREAVEAAPRVPYVEKVVASDNLRWSLSKNAVDADATPLGRADPVIGESAEPSAGGSGGASPN